MRARLLGMLVLGWMSTGCGDDTHSRKNDASALADGAVRDAASSDASHLGGMDAAVFTDGGLPASDAALPISTSDAGAVLCGGRPCACSDGLDNDGDGLVDMADPECVASWDNDEGSLATGIPGDNRDDACQDCFFDGNSGSGDDGCRIPSSCLTEGNASSGQGSCNSCTADMRCKNFCQAYTPNGCDCFGCCAIQLGSNVTKNVLLGAGCSIDGTTLTGCTECVQSTSCVNTCGRCELCPGKSAADLPADCNGAGGSDAGAGGSDASAPTPSCEQGEARCGTGLPACGSDQVCSFGCCILAPVF